MVQEKFLPPIYIVGTTASGKSELAFLLAKKLDGVIISADSMQIYQGLDIGTAKESSERRAEVPHKMIDIVAPSANFSVADFAKLAREEIFNAQKCNHLPIVVGGTGLYFEALLYPLRFAGVEIDKSLRENLTCELEKFGTKYMHDKLLSIDPDSAAILHENDTKRVIRAIEIVLATGKTRAENADTRETPDAIMIGLGTERKTLYDRINSRVDTMFENGLVDEVLSQDSFFYQSMQAIGYKEFSNCAYKKIGDSYQIDEIELASIKDKIKQASRNYAKRQLTWFRKYPFIKWFECGDYNSALDYIMDCIDEHMNI